MDTHPAVRRVTTIRRAVVGGIAATSLAVAVGLGFATENAELTTSTSGTSTSGTSTAATSTTGTSTSAGTTNGTSSSTSVSAGSSTATDSHATSSGS